MIYAPSPLAIGVFVTFILIVIGLSAWLGRRATSAAGYYAAHGEIHWFVNGIAFAGDYLSAASFLGICGMIAFYGYDGFLYSIGYLAGWIVALFVIAEPLKRLGKFTFADALDSRFHSRGIKLAAAISTLVVSLFYLIPQMVGAGALITPLLGLPHVVGVLMVGVVVILIVVTAGMVSTTWVQFIKGSLLVLFCFVLTVLILRRGLIVNGGAAESPFAARPAAEILARPGHRGAAEGRRLGRQAVHAVQDRASGASRCGARRPATASLAHRDAARHGDAGGRPSGRRRAAGQGRGAARPAAGRPRHVAQRRGSGATSTRPARPGRRSSARSARASIQLWGSERVVEDDGAATTVYYQKVTRGDDLLVAGASPTFAGVRSAKLFDKLNFLSLMLALFCGTASLPHILIRYYTVKDEAAARKSTVVGIAAHRLLLRADAVPRPRRDDQRRARRHQHQHGGAAAGQELQRAAVRDHLGHRVHDGARHGQRPDHRGQRRGRARPDGQRLPLST